jgi:prophage regulatory protein
LRFLSREDLIERGITYSRVHLDRLEASGKFPRRVPLSANRVAWIEEEVDAWAAERLAERDNPRPRLRRGRSASTISK